MIVALLIALIGVAGTLGGVKYGASLQRSADAGAREEERATRREEARREREIVAAERLDEGLVKVFEAFQGIHGDQRGKMHMQAFDDWSEAWVAYGPRIGDAELGERYRSVATMLMDLIDAEQLQGETNPTTMHAVEAIRNARAALAHFIRDQGELPASSFPGPSELVALLNEGERDGDRLAPLRAWQNRERANKVQTLPTPSSAIRPAKAEADSAP